MNTERILSDIAREIAVLERQSYVIPATSIGGSRIDVFMWQKVFAALRDAYKFGYHQAVKDCNEEPT
jgi:hypothetical protein